MKGACAGHQRFIGPVYSLVFVLSLLVAPGAAQESSSGGEAAFWLQCTVCHDADRALGKRKSPAAWLATVRRMAAMDDAEIPSSAIVPIASWLASRSAQPEPTQASDAGGQTPAVPEAATQGQQMAQQMAHLAEDVGRLSSSATLSTLWRGGNDNLENSGFFPDAWVRLDMQPAGRLRGRVTACTSCHSDQTGDAGFTVELVEAFASLDLIGHEGADAAAERCRIVERLDLQAGRFVVPFGAYAAMSHPGIYRTVTNPLMFNMGRQVNRDGSRPPVLPMPYADEGVNLSAKLRLTDGLKATIDLFGVNGLRGSAPGVRFRPSRSYVDNNGEPAFGGRATISGSNWRVGGSLMAGRMHDTGQTPLQYELAGGDATIRLLDNQVRLYYEYAIRDNDSLLGRSQISYGNVAQMELLLLSAPNVTALFRYDDLTHHDASGSERIERFTWGLTTTLLDGSLLIFNHERWQFRGQADTDVLGIRWVATF